MTSLGKFVTEGVEFAQKFKGDWTKDTHPWAVKEELCFHEYQHWIVAQRHEPWSWMEED